MLLKQGTAEVDMIAETFYLSEGEKALLLSADVGEGLFFAGQNHVAMKVFAAPFEHELITSNPMEILKRQQDQKQANMETVSPEQAQTAIPMTSPTYPSAPASPTAAPKIEINKDSSSLSKVTNQRPPTPGPSHT